MFGDKAAHSLDQRVYPQSHVRIGARFGDGYFLGMFALACWGISALLHLHVHIPGAAVLAIVMTYEVCGIALWGRTFGKWWTKTRVVDVRTGAIPSWPRSVARAGVLLLMSSAGLFHGVHGNTIYQAFVSLIQLAVWCVPLFHPQRRGLHDLAARTVVIYG